MDKRNRTTGQTTNYKTLQGKDWKAKQLKVLGATKSVLMEQ
jgi:hypothetical protein